MSVDLPVIVRPNFLFILGRGKTHIARRLGRYLDFFHAIPVKVLHVADYRRRLCGAMPDADWFDPLNEVAAAKREECQMAAVQDVNVFLGQHSNGVVIVDSINETHAKRRNLTSVVCICSQSCSYYCCR